MLPQLDEYGNLPAGIHRASIEEVADRFVMTEQLSPLGYEQTKVKLANLERRLAEIQRRRDLPPEHRGQVLRSYQQMMRQYRREIKLYEAIGQQTTRPR